MEEIGETDFAKLRENVARVRERMRRTEERAGRPAGSVRLVAVTKTVPPAWVSALRRLGVNDFGENRPEDVPPRIACLGSNAAGTEWHLIGHYQKRKIRPTLACFRWIHSVHDAPLLAKIDEVARETGRTVSVLLQVNASGEAAKQGFRPAEIGPLVESWSPGAAARIRGIMTMAPAGRDSGALRRLFAEVRGLRDRIARADLPLPELSMGMSGDFEEAILEGATMVRVGSALFDGLSARPS